MTMKLKPYPEYKDSGVPWLGKVPEHWEHRNFRTILKPKAGRNKPNWPLLSVVREKGVIVRNVKDDSENHNVIPEDLSNYKIVHKGEFAMNKMKAWQGSFGISNFDGIVSPAYFVFDLNNVEPHFFHIAARSKAYVPFFTQASDGVRVGQWDLSLTRMKEIPFWIPLPDEQNQIARFLDYKSSQITRFIRAKKRMVELLKEQKQAIINDAVTGKIEVRTGKPYLKYKESGVGWLGVVPEGWEVRKLSHISIVSNGSTPSNTDPNYWNNGTHPWLNSSKVNDTIVMEPSALITEKAVVECSLKIIPKGSIIIGLVGQGKTRGTCTILGIDAFVNQNVAAIVPYSKSLISAYLKVLLVRNYQTIRDMGRGGNQEALNSQIIKSLRLPIPPIDVQADVVKHINVPTIQIDHLILRTQREISLLTEYRTRLIADVVTGKIDVRNINVPDLPLDNMIIETDTADQESGEEPEDAVASMESED